MLGTGLIAGAAFAVGARRQLRVLGLLGAAGAESRHVRAIVLMGGVTLGFAGSLLGVLLGVAGTYALSPLLDRLAGRVVGAVDIPVTSLTGTVALGTLAATLAAFGPARSAARLSVVQALAERAPAPRRPGRLAVVGLVAAAGGAGITSLATAAHADLWLAAGLPTMVVGFLVAIPLLVTWTGRIAGTLPTLTRIATRDVARHGRRAGAAIAAAAIALAAPVAIATVTMADEASQERVPYMATDHLLVQSFGLRGQRGIDALRKAEEALLDAFPGSIVAPIVPAVTLVERNGRERERRVIIEGPRQTTSDGIAYTIDGYLLIGGPDLLRAYHAEDGIEALERGEIVGLGPDTVEGDTVDLSLEGSGTLLHSGLPATETRAQYSSISFSGLDLVVSPERASELGLRPSRSANNLMSVFRATRPMGHTDIQRARDVVEQSGRAYVTSLEDLGSDAGFARTVTSLIGMGLALAIVTVVVALLAAESRRDRAILVAIGASPRTRRTVAGLYAAVVGVLSGVLGFIAGFFPAVVFLFGQATDFPLLVPWTVLAGVLLGVPALAGTIGAMASRQPRAAQLLRPIA